MVMLVNVVQANRRILGRGAALLLLTGMAAGCSSQVARFNSPDDVFTASTDNQRQIIRNDNQPYPGDVAPAAPVAPMHTGSVSHSTLAPVASQPYPEPAVARVQTAPVERPVIVAERPEPAQRPIAVRPRPAPAVAEPAPFKPAEKEVPIATLAPRETAGWSRVGGTQITVRDGDSMLGLAHRYGVPAKVIAETNGMPADGGGLKTGQKIIIPTSADGRKAADAKVVADVRKAIAPAGKPATVRVVTTEPRKAEAVKTASVEAAPTSSKKAVAKADVIAAKKPEAKTEKKSELIAEKKSEPAVEKKSASAAAGGYTVQSGDTLSKIARKTGVSTAALKSANGLKDGPLKIGQTLKAPSGSQVAAAKAVDPTMTSSTPPAKQAVTETATASAYTPPKKADKVMDDAEASKDVAPDATGIGKMRWPVRGRVVSGYGKGGGKSNDGIDIAVPEGTAVKAAENGVVIYAGDGLKEFGNTVLVRHENGLVTVYGNASSLNVKRGEKVKRGQDIAVSGMSGNADSPKLHFEVRKNSAPVDPSTFLE